MAIILIRADEDTEGLTRAEVLALEVDDYTLEEEYADTLDDVYGPVSIAGYEYETSRVLREVDPTAFRCGFADYVSEYAREVDPDDFPESLDDENGED